MIWLAVIIAILLVCFAGVLLFGAPYLPTLRPQMQLALELANLKPGQTLLELGCGDGRVLIAAAKQGVNSIGYELNPIMAVIAWLRTRRYRRHVKIVWGDFWRADWPSADAIFTFLLPRYMDKLDKKCMAYAHKPIKLVSFAFEINERPASAHKKGVFLYEYTSRLPAAENSANMKRMIKHNQDGLSGAAVSLVLCVVLLIGALGFGIWAYSSRQDYKSNTDAKIADAVSVAKKEESVVKDRQFAEESKNPLKTYSGPQAYGSIILQYPKTWSGYVVDTTGNNGSSSGAPVDGYFHPGVVPSVGSDSSVFSLRMQVIGQSYAQVLDSISSSDSDNPPVIKPYALPRVPKAVGVQISGKLPINDGNGEKTGVMVILPLRSQTIKLWTEGTQYTKDFNKYILPNFSFSP
jgi:hypothetical protein